MGDEKVMVGRGGQKVMVRVRVRVMVRHGG